MLIFIMKWCITYANKKAFNFVSTLSPKLKARFIALTDKMMEQGHNLGMPHSRALKEGLFELRLKADEGIARVFYASVVKNEIIILHGYVKKTQKLSNKELRIARARLKEVIKNERKK